MKKNNFSTSACRYCGFYQPEGRRGGSCQRLGVSVQGSWKACTFASHPFETTLKKLEDIFQLPNAVELCSEDRPVSNIPDIELENYHKTKAINKQKLACD